MIAEDGAEKVREPRAQGPTMFGPAVKTREHLLGLCTNADQAAARSIGRTEMASSWLLMPKSFDLLKRAPLLNPAGQRSLSRRRSPVDKHRVGCRKSVNGNRR